MNDTIEMDYNYSESYGKMVTAHENVLYDETEGEIGMLLFFRLLYYTIFYVRRRGFRRFKCL